MELYPGPHCADFIFCKKSGKEMKREEKRGKERKREEKRGKEREREGKRGKEREREGMRGKERERERELTAVPPWNHTSYHDAFLFFDSTTLCTVCVTVVSHLRTVLTTHTARLAAAVTLWRRLMSLQPVLKSISLAQLLA